MLPIDEVEEAKRFYVEGLGFSVVFEAHYPNAAETGTILGIERGGLRLHLDSPMPGHGRAACAVLEVEDADALYAAWRGQVDIEEPPVDEPWGACTFGVLDPFGNDLFVVGPARLPEQV